MITAKTISNKYSGRTAIIFDDKSVSYSDISTISNIVALNLWKLGIKKFVKESRFLEKSCLMKFLIMPYTL